MHPSGAGASAQHHQVTVAMATFNGARYLPEQLDSLACQTQPPAELVVVDDGSEDDTVAVVERFASEAPFAVRLHRNEATLGWGANFVKAISLARSELVAPCDQDDVWAPDKLAKCTRWFSTVPGLALVVHSCRVTDEQLKPTRERLPDFRRTRVLSPEELPFGFAHHGMALVFPRWLFECVPFDERPLATDRGAPRRMNHDSWIAFLATLAGPVAVMSDELVRYRRHEDNATPLRLPTGGDKGVAGLFDVDAKAAAYRVLAGRHQAAAAFLDGVRPRLGHVDAAVVRRRAEGRAAQHRHAAANFRARADTVARSTSRARRLVRLTGLALRGGYGRRRKAGLGVASLGVDLVTTLGLGRRSASTDEDQSALADGS